MARLAVLIFLALMLAASCGGGQGAVLPPGSSNPSNVQVDQNAASSALAVLNEYRRMCSIPPVALDTKLSKGAQLHANYLYTNSVSLGAVGLQAHKEFPGTPGYSVEGNAAGQNSVIYEGVTATQSVHNWMQTLYHRLGMMDPNLKSIGFGSQGPYQVMDVGQGRLRGLLASDGVSLFPGPGMTNVPGGYVREIPHPIATDSSIGIPISIEFFGLRGILIGPPTVRLRDITPGRAPRELGYYLQYPGRPFLKDWDLGQLIAIIPQAPLPNNSLIEVEVSALVDGATFNPKWQFTTR